MSSTEEKTILSRKLSILSPPSETEEEVSPIRKPRGSNEERRAEHVNTFLGISDLSYLINEYEASFEGKLRHRITIPDNYIKGALSLDNDRIMVLVLSKVDKTFNIFIYNANNAELLDKKVLAGEISKTASVYNMYMTPKRNVYISFLSNRKSYTYYCNQKGEALWSKIFGSREGNKLCILNDDSVIFRIGDSIIKKTIDGEEKLDIPEGKFTPCGARGFIILDESDILLYNNNMEEKKIELESTYITTIKPINTNIILFGTELGTLICYDAIKDKEIASINIKGDNKYINGIEMLTHNRCLLLCGKDYARGDDAVMIYDLGNLSEVPEAEYKNDFWINYLGTLSNGDVVIYHVVIDEEGKVTDGNIIVHDVLNNKSREFHLEYDDELENLKFCDISSKDELLSLDVRNNAVLLWR